MKGKSGEHYTRRQRSNICTNVGDSQCSAASWYTPMFKPIDNCQLTLSTISSKLTRHAEVVDGTSKRRLELECTSIRINRLFRTSTISEGRSESVPELKVLQKGSAITYRGKTRDSPSA